MKKNLLMVLLMILGTVSKAQFNNEWIDYSKTYYKFKVGSSGLYRISPSMLQQAGLDNVPLEHFKVFRNGQEVPLYTTRPFGVAGPSDYIEFYGEMNDGKTDTKLYRQASLHLDNTWSLLTDTAAYFLTVDPTGINLRVDEEINDVAANTLSPEPYFIYTFTNSYRQQISPGFASVLLQGYVYSSSYDAGEGWSSRDVYPSSPLNETVQLFPYSTGANAVISVGASGGSLNSRNIEIAINGTVVLNERLNAFGSGTRQANFPASVLGRTGGDNIVIRNTSTEPADRMMVSNYRIAYPRQFNFGGSRQFEFQLGPNPLGNYLEISNFNAGATAPVLYDLTNRKRYVGELSGSLIRFALKPSFQPRRLVLLNAEPSQVNSVTSMAMRNFINYADPSNQGDYLIISHPKLYRTSTSTNPVEEYRQYRSSAAGGSYNAKIHEIEQLIDQFAFGIKSHPLAVKNFVNMTRSTYAAKPKYVLIIGRGLLYDQFRRFESIPVTYDMDLVPTFGSPGSDNLLVSPDYSAVSDIPAGRIAAVTGDEVDIYLQKLKQYEAVPGSAQNTIEDRAWMKNVVHAIGGSDPYLQGIINGYMAANRTIIEDTLFGARVHSFSKNSALAIDDLTSEQLAGLFREGLGLVTYFGHSSTNTLEFNIDDPEKYDNTGKYPVFIVNGCNAGNIFSYDTLRIRGGDLTLSEKFVLVRDKGVIGFLASSHFGTVNYLNNYTRSFYASLARDQYGKELGQVQMAAFQKMIQNTLPSDFYTRMHTEQINLHGDPAVKIYGSVMPDYVIEDPLVKISPTPVSVADNNFELLVKYQNIGKAVEDSIRILIQRQLPNGTTIDIFNGKVRAANNIDSIRLSVPVNPLTDKGENKILITLDVDGSITELSESNNTLTKSFVIIQDELRPIFPYNYAIVNTPTVTFYASAADPYSTAGSYAIEVDTTELFNSSFKKSMTMQSKGGLLQFNIPSLTLSDSTVYYWRTAPVPPQGTDYVWNTSSFVYLSNGSPGYNQSHYYQFRKNKYNNIVLNEDRSFRFVPRSRTLSIKTGLAPVYFDDKLEVTIDERKVVTYGCRYSSLQIVVYDKVTLEPWYNESQPNGLGRFNSWNPCIHNDNAFEYPYADPAFRRRAIEFLESIPDNYFISITNLGADFNSSFINSWMADTATLGSGRSLYHVLKKLGFADIDSFTSNKPFIFLTRKGDRNFPIYQSIGNTGNDYLEMEMNIAVTENRGTIESPWFGPVQSWEKLIWSGRDLHPNSDLVNIQVYGKDFAGNEQLLATVTPATDTSLAFIDAKAFPYVRLKMNNKDSLNGSPNQLRYWRLLAKLPPEGAVAPNIVFKAKDSVDIGEPLMLELAFKNVSQSDFTDSIKVQMVLTDRSNVSRELVVPKQKPLKQGDTLMLRYPVDTRALAGENTLFVNFNPNYAQPEQYLFNNFLFKSFRVKNDQYDPTLDVTFDGARILHQDIVSAKPHILIKLTDNNKYLLLDDTSLLSVKVRNLSTDVTREYQFNNDTLRFTPAVNTGGNGQNTATIDFFPYFPEDGYYELIVKGSDRSGNSAGAIEYKVTFSVVNKPMISNLLNYPNPFTTSTAFVFTITGSELPSSLRIQILTITGKIVREITKEELGPIRIGRNITEYKWDGTDQYGQKLANGVYLYRVITNLNGKSMDRLQLDGINGDKYNDRSTDKYFRSGYGKMYLMR